jgi:hypothetical protein
MNAQIYITSPCAPPADTGIFSDLVPNDAFYCGISLPYRWLLAALVLLLGATELINRYRKSNK